MLWLRLICVTALQVVCQGHWIQTILSSHAGQSGSKIEWSGRVLELCLLCDVARYKPWLSCNLEAKVEATITATQSWITWRSRHLQPIPHAPILLVSTLLPMDVTNEWSGYYGRCSIYDHGQSRPSTIPAEVGDFHSFYLQEQFKISLISIRTSWKLNACVWTQPHFLASWNPSAAFFLSLNHLSWRRNSS